MHRLRYFLALGMAVTLMALTLSGLWAKTDDGVVGDGTPASCDNNTLGAALQAGGTVTFNCGANPHVIIADTYVISNDVVVDGADLITLDGEELRQIFIVEGEASLTLRNIVLTRGFASSGPGGAIWNFGTLLLENTTIRESGTDTVLAGGALANDSNGVVTLENSLIENNSAADGAAIYTIGASVTLRNTTVRNNITRSNGGFYGGGGILQEVNGDAVLTIEGSTIQGNHSNPNGSVGGGIALLAGTLSIVDSTLSENVGYGGGGGIYSAYGTTIEIRRSRLLDNRTAPGNGENTSMGGAIYNSGNLTIAESVFSGNQATDAGAIFSGDDDSSLTLRQSTVHGNSATTGGGGLLLVLGTNLIENSTISGNTGALGGGLRSGITAGEGTATLRNVTLSGNSPDNLYVDEASEPVLVQNSLLVAAPEGSNCNSGAPLTSGGHNLESDESCGFTAAGDGQNTDPLLGALANNGGLTPTHLPQAGSPAIDAGDDDACPALDQRGVARPVGDGCDVGAVEVGEDVAPPQACGGAFTAIADATLDPAAPATPLGGDPDLRLAKQGESVTGLLLRFAPADFPPPGATLGAAYLELRLSGDAPGGVYPIEVRGVTGDWDEATVAWDGRPQTGAIYSARSHSGGTGVARIDITELALSWIAGARLGEVWLQPFGGADVEAHFAAHEAGDGAPRLVLTCTPQAQAPFPDHGDADARQLAGLERLQSLSALPVTIEFGDDGGVRHAAFRLPIPAGVGEDSHVRAQWFFDEYKDLLRLANPDAQLQLAQYDEANLHPRYRQIHDGIPVYPAELVVHFDGSDVVGLTGTYLPDVTALPVPFIDLATATELALAIGGPGSEVAGVPQLRYVVPAVIALDDPHTRLAWQISLLAPDRTVYLFLDAHSGELLLEEPRTRDAFLLALWNGANMGPSAGSTCWNTIPNEVLWYTQAGLAAGAAPNTDGQTAFTVISNVYNYWRNTAGINRDSYRGNGNAINLYVNVGNPWANAQFSPACDIMEFGAGRISQDIAAHEFTHGVVNSTAGLIYQNQSGALDESFSDIFGYFTDNDDWTIGEASGFGAIRDMSNPPRFSVVRGGVTLPHPDRMSNFVTAAQLGNVENNAAAGGNNNGVCDPFETCVVFDNGGVHINSGIQNKVAYLLVNGGTFNGRTIRPIGQVKAQVLFYRMLSQNRLTANATLLDARNAAVALALEEANRLLGIFNDDDVCQVRNAFAAVELGLGDAACDGNEDIQGLGSDDDGDGDRVPNDNCPVLYNPGQRDIDGDGIGDACDGDMDADAICNAGGPFVPGAGIGAGGCQPGAMTVDGAPADNCPTVANTDQLNRFGSAKGDVCDDVDEDDVVDALDNCPQLYQWRTEDWRDSDGDGQGDLCDGDIDGDFQPNTLDNCPFVRNYNGWGNGEDTTETSRGLPADGVGDACDLCPAVSSADNSDLDGDGLANPCDLDDDNDAICDVGGPLPGGIGGVPAPMCQAGKGSQNGQPADNCPLTANPDQTDFDGNGVGFVCDGAEADWLEGVIDQYGTRYPVPGVGTQIPIPVCPQCGGNYLPNSFEQVFKLQVPSGFRAVITDNFSNVVAQSTQTAIGQIVRFNPAPFALRTQVQGRAVLADELMPAEVLYFLEFIPDETVDPEATYEVTVDLDEGVGVTPWSVYLPSVIR